MGGRHTDGGDRGGRKNFGPPPLLLLRSAAFSIVFFSLLRLPAAFRSHARSMHAHRRYLQDRRVLSRSAVNFDPFSSYPEGCSRPTSISGLTTTTPFVLAAAERVRIEATGAMPPGGSKL